MTYKEAMNYIAHIESFGSVLGLSRISTLLSKLSNPQNTLNIIHVAGTNGKGSVCTFITAVLKAAGYKVGRFISPTLYHYRERIQINDKYISEADVAGLIERIRAAIDQMLLEGQEHPTVFEVETAMAFMYYQEQQCDFVVLEVGLGGRDDSTNVIEHSLLSVITPISYDHMQYLGDTLMDIVKVKAGIIKRGQRVVIGPQEAEALDVIMSECIRKKATPTLTDISALTVKRRSLTEQCFDYKSYPQLTISMPGLYQTENAAIAIEVIHALHQCGFDIDPKFIYQGLKEAHWKGRFEVLHQQPVIIVDGAHNPAGARALVQSLQTYFGGRTIRYLMGVFADKDYQQMLDILASAGDTLITLKPDSPRGLSSAVLMEAAESRFADVRDGKTVEQALAMALNIASPQDVIVACGTLSMIGTLSREVQKMREVIK